MKVQARYLLNLRAQQEQYEVPILCAGDVFHKWNSSPELINFALVHLPNEFYAIPGQHDLPFHDLESIHRSAYWTCVQAGKIQHLDSMRVFHPTSTRKDMFAVYPFPWGVPVEPIRNVDCLTVALIHAYCWTGNAKFHEAPEEQSVRGWDHLLEGYDVAVFGDNHKGFLCKTTLTDCTVFNHGAFQCRNLDERKYRPRLGLLMSDGVVELIDVDTSKDQWVTPDEAPFTEADTFNVASFVEELRKLGDEKPLDFQFALRAYVKSHKLSPGAQMLIAEAVEHGGGK